MIYGFDCVPTERAVEKQTIFRAIKIQDQETMAISSSSFFSDDWILALLPLSVPLTLCLRIVFQWRENTSQQLLAYMTMAALGYFATVKLIPSIQIYTLRKGICGKDLGKKGTPLSDIPM
jgi:hypothetical protein